jgi:hypothetical protein
MYPQPTYKPGTAEPKYEQNSEPPTFDGPTAESGWPVIPPQASGAPTVVPDQTVRMASPAESEGEATRLMRPVVPPSAAPATIETTKASEP